MVFAGPGPSSQMSHIELGLSEQSVLTSSVDLAGTFFFFFFFTEIAIYIWLTALAMTVPLCSH